MTNCVIEGGRPLVGRLRVQGAKNAVLPLLAGSLLAGRSCRLVDAPPLADVMAMSELLEALGASVTPGVDASSGLPCLDVQAGGPLGHVVPDDLMRRLRSSVVVLGSLLARCGRARISQPGGCEIGPRPIDFHLRGLAELGARVFQEGGYVVAEAPGGLRGAEIYLDLPSVGATETVMLAATGARGPTVIRNAAREPEIVDLQNFLCACGARVSGAGSSQVTVHGDGLPLPGGCRHVVIPDRIEAGTWCLAAAITGGDVVLENVVPEHLGALAAKLGEAGFPLEVGMGWVRLRTTGLGRPRATNIQTQPFPGFPTDLQNPMLALLLVARGTSIVTETVFENRFRVLTPLAQMGAQASTYGRMVVVNGVPRLHGAQVQAPFDLRGAAALVLAGLSAEGTTVVRGAECLYRGYHDFIPRLRGLGARVWAGEAEGASGANASRRGEAG